MSLIIGREREKQELQKLINSTENEFLAVFNSTIRLSLSPKATQKISATS